jgi:hypothetical protein
MLSVTYDQDDTVEGIASAYSGPPGGDETFFNGVPLTSFGTCLVS